MDAAQLLKEEIAYISELRANIYDIQSTPVKRGRYWYPPRPLSHKEKADLQKLLKIKLSLQRQLQEVENEQ